MKPISETYKELGIAFSFPITIIDDGGYRTYFENSNGWEKWERDDKGNVTYFENSKGFFEKWEFDAHGNLTYFEDRDGWAKWERDDNGNETYYENSDGYKKGTPRSAKT